MFVKGVDIQADICDLPIKNDGYDIIICSMVLEHIPDDRKAMRELFRVLKPDGVAFVIVPLYEATFEDDSIIEPLEREKAFGQDDHVRRYGIDIVDRLKEAGFRVEGRNVKDELSDDERNRFSIGTGEGDTVFVCWKKEE